MGTSRNDPSPKTPPWRLSNAMLGREGLSAQRQSQQIWRAASSERGRMLVQDFSATVFAAACGIADKAASPQDAVAEYSRTVSQEYAAGLSIEMGKRAIARSVAQHTGAVGFAAELFSEAVSYYASRDLPSVVGKGGRLSSTRDAIELKQGIRDATKKVVQKVGAPPRAGNRWPQYVTAVIAALKETGAAQ